MGHREMTAVGRGAGGREGEEWVRPSITGGDFPGGLGHPGPTCLCWGHQALTPLYSD